MSKYKYEDYGDNFQTPKNVCDYMSSLVPLNVNEILEPTPGKGFLVESLSNVAKVISPNDFNDVVGKRFECIVMNPPFTPMKLGYDILYECMEMSDNIIALMPYLSIINGEKRTNDIMNYGLKSITHLPRSVFKGSRVQTCILEMEKGYKGETIFKLLPKNE